MILALDVAYEGQTGIVGMVEFRTWSADEANYCGTISSRVECEYVPGEFYKKVLPCLLKALTFRNSEYKFLKIKSMGRDTWGEGRCPGVSLFWRNVLLAEILLNACVLYLYRHALFSWGNY